MKTSTIKKLSKSNMPGFKKCGTQSPALKAMLEDANDQIIRCMYVISLLTTTKESLIEKQIDKLDPATYEANVKKIDEELISFNNLKEELVTSIETIKEVTDVTKHMNDVQKTMNLLVKLASKTHNLNSIQKENNISEITENVTNVPKQIEESVRPETI